ncbi:MAG: hypothetical protein KF774_05810 [Planctomyces sp.]|nr:hypothetical protein [Planctomyces sp.]
MLALRRFGWMFLAVVTFAGVLAVVVGFTRGPAAPEPFLVEAHLTDSVHRLRLLKLQAGALDYDWQDPAPPIARALSLPGYPRHVPFVPVHLPGRVKVDHWGRTHRDVEGLSFLFRIVDEQGRYDDLPGWFPTIEFEESTGFRFSVDAVGVAADHRHWGVFAGTRAPIPRREPNLTMLVQQSPDASPLRFEVPNPMHRPEIREWMPQPLPITVQTGPHAVTLRSLVVRSPTQIEPQFELSTPGWHVDPGFLWLEDATGNIGQSLSPFEPAWKGVARLMPLDAAEAAPEETWVIGPLRIPAPGEVVPLREERVIHGVTLTLESISGGGADDRSETASVEPPEGSHTRVMQGAVEALQSAPHIKLLASSADGAFHLLLRMTGASRGWKTARESRVGPTQKRTVLLFDPPEGADEVTLEVVCFPESMAEFVFEPPQELRDTVLRSLDRPGSGTEPGSRTAD